MAPRTGEAWCGHPCYPIEPNQFKQTYLIMRIENACIRQIGAGSLDYGFARVSWTRDLLACLVLNSEQFLSERPEGIEGADQVPSHAVVDPTVPPSGEAMKVPVLE